MFRSFLNEHLIMVSALLFVSVLYIIFVLSLSIVCSSAYLPAPLSRDSRDSF